MLILRVCTVISSRSILPNFVYVLTDLIDLVSHVSADPDQRYVDALRKKMQETSELVAGFVRLASEVHIAAVDKEAYKGCQKAQTEVRSLMSIMLLSLITII